MWCAPQQQKGGEHRETDNGRFPEDSQDDRFGRKPALFFVPWY